MKARKFFVVATIVGVVLMLAFASFYDLKGLHGRVSSLPGLLVFLLVAILPLVGAPVSVLYVLAGAKFGPGWGLAWGAVAIAIHLVASWWIAQSWLQRPVQALLRRAGYAQPSFPKDDAVAICLLVALVPGLSYTLKNYLLVLGGIPFRSFFFCCLPAHFFHAVLAILFGDFTGDMTPGKITFLVVYGLVLAGLSRHVVRRMRERKQIKALEVP